MAASSPDLKQLEEIDYRTGVHKLLLALALGVCLVVAFLSNFPLEERVQALVKAELAKLPGCRPNFERLQFELLMPKILLSDVQLPGGCLGGGKPLTMRSLAVNFVGPSLSPFGPAFRVEGDLQGQPLSFLYVAGLTTQMLRLEENITLSRLAGALPSLPKMEGRLRLDARVTMSKGALADLKLLAESKDFVVAAQNLGDFKIPRLVLNSFALKINSESPQRLLVEEFVLGKPGATDSPVRARFKGPIDLVTANPSSSQLRLKGEAALSPAFLESFPILNLMLPQFTQKDGFYQIAIYGSLGQPRLSAP